MNKYYYAPWREKTQVRCKTPKRMDIWFADLGSQNGTCETKGVRPVLIISNDISNRCAPVVTVLPMTREIKRLDLVAHVVEGESMIMAEQITTIDKKKLCRKIGHYENPEVEKAVMKALSQFLNLNGTDAKEGELYAMES